MVFGLLVLGGCTPYMKGTMDLERKNYEAAIESFQKELTRNPNNWQARQGLGLAYLKTGENDKAIDEFQFVLGQDTEATTAFAYAPGTVDRELAQKPEDPFATFYLGMAYLYNGQRADAIKTLNSYKNRRAPLTEEEIRSQLILIEIFDSIHLARQALEEEKKLGTLPPEPGTVAVFYFKDLSPDNRFRYLQKAMAEMVITDLAQVKSLRVLERVRVQYLLTEMGLGQTGIVEEETAPRAGRLLGAENLIVGSLEPGSLSAKGSVASTITEDVIGAFSVTADQEKFFILEKEIVYNILKVLPVTFTPEEEIKFQAYHTESLQAVLYFGQGLDELDVGNWQDAKAFFKKAVDEDPEFELAKFYFIHCPTPVVASSNALAGLTVDQLASNVENAVNQASAAEEALLTEQGRGLQESEISEASPGEGSISVSW
jgi:tetratricopeptide (TPR) repeat protein